MLLAMLLCMTMPAAYAQAHCTQNGCPVCEVAGKINALPEADAITADNAAAVIEQIHAIDRIKTALTDDAYEALLQQVETQADTSGGGLAVPKRYTEALERATNLTGAGSLVVLKKFLSANETVDVTGAQVQLELTRVDGGQNAAQTLTLAELSYDMTGLYQANEDGWTYTYPLAPGMYTLVETGDSGAKVGGRDFVTGSTVYSVNGQPIQKGEPFEIAADSNCIVVIGNTHLEYPQITVSNVVEDDVSENEAFNYTLTATNENGNPCKIWYDDGETYATGTVSFTLKARENKSFSVPNGCSYIVKQEKKAGFEVDQLEYSGTATNDASFTFINTRVEQPPQEDDGDETDDLPPQEDDEDGTDDLPPQDGADDLPETGDPSSLLGWAALLSASIAGLKRRKTR